MANFKKGDKVKIRLEANSQFRGHAGIITAVLKRESRIFGYIVEIDSQGKKISYQFSERDLENVNEK